MALKFNKNSNEFYLVSNNRAKAQEVGLTQSAKAKGPNGEAVWFTDSPYAALCFYEEAEGVAREKLEPLHMDYMASMANEWPYSSKRCPEGMEFMPFQNAGIDYALNRPNALVGDAMGLGKTMQGIGVANELGATKVIVVCPGAVRLNWQREIKNWSVIPNVSSYPILKSADGVNPYANYVIVSYDLLRNEHILHTIANMQWDLAILDEGHYLKSIDAKRTQATFGTSDCGSFHDHYLVKNAQMILPLTGTPLPNRPTPSVGERIGSFTVKSIKYRNTGTVEKVICDCDCGGETETTVQRLRNGRASRCRSCGAKKGIESRYSEYKEVCPDDEVRRNLLNRITGIIQRCHNPNNSSYNNYGKRGIKVYKKWRDNRKMFLEHLVSLQGHSNKELSIDRIDNDKGYVPGNIQFISHKENMGNRRSPFEMQKEIDRLKEKNRKLRRRLRHCECGA